MQIEYRKRRKFWKYELINSCAYTPKLALPDAGEVGDFISIRNGEMFFKALYGWDGASSLAVDTPNIMGPSLVHDAGYELMRTGKLPATRANRKLMDQIFHAACLENGMWEARAWWIYRGVRVGGRKYASLLPASFNTPIKLLDLSGSWRVLETA